jgi:hypothetical protein
MEIWSHRRDQLEERLARPATGETTMSQQSTGTPRDLQAHLIGRAWKDEAFKQELLSNPKAVVERELRELSPGATLPEHVQIQVLEETPTIRYLVLPARPVIDSGEALSDADLAHVAAAGVRSYSWIWHDGECVDM